MKFCFVLYRERINRLLGVFADDYRELRSLSAGNIAVAVGLKEVCSDLIITYILYKHAMRRKTQYKKCERSCI